MRRRHQRGAAAEADVAPAVVDDQEIVLLGAQDLAEHVADKIFRVEDRAFGIDGLSAGRSNSFANASTEVELSASARCANRPAPESRPMGFCCASSRGAGRRVRAMVWQA